MMYLETITDSSDTFRIERQKDTPNGEWYGLWLYQNNNDVSVKTLADNEDFIHDMEVTLRDNPKRVMKEIGLEYNQAHVKTLRKIIRKAIKLGWFDNSES